MADWLEKYRASVSWGDEITYAFIPEHGIECCFIEHDKLRTYLVPAALSDIPKAAEDARTVNEVTGSPCAALFTDEDATAAQVEQAMVTLGQFGHGCAFIEPKPQVHLVALSDRYSEGEVFKKAVQVLQEAAADE